MTIECADCAPGNRCNYPGRCACCGSPHSGEGYDICINCGWERDWGAENKSDPKYDVLGPNHATLDNYRAEWIKEGEPFWGESIVSDPDRLASYLEDPIDKVILEKRGFIQGEPRKYRSEDPEVQACVDEEHQRWWDEIVAEQKEALKRLRNGRMSSMVPGADDMERSPFNLTEFEASLIVVCIDKQIGHLQACTLTYEEMLKEEPPEGSDEDDAECIRRFSELCNKDVNALTALRFHIRNMPGKLL